MATICLRAAKTKTFRHLLLLLLRFAVLLDGVPYHYPSYVYNLSHASYSYLKGRFTMFVVPYSRTAFIRLLVTFAKTLPGIFGDEATKRT